MIMWGITLTKKISQYPGQGHYALTVSGGGLNIVSFIWCENKMTRMINIYVSTAFLIHL